MVERVWHLSERWLDVNEAIKGWGWVNMVGM